MNRRYFLRAIGLVSAAAACGHKLLAKGYTDMPVGDLTTRTHDTRPVPYDKPKRPADPIFMVSVQIDSVGFESTPVPVWANEHGYLELPYRSEYIDPVRNGRYLVPDGYSLPPIDRYVIYAPMPGFEQTGPWYWLRKVSRRDAKSARYTIAVPEYKTCDLVPVQASYVAVELPPSTLGQDYWAARSPGSTHTAAIIKCP